MAVNPAQNSATRIRRTMRNLAFMPGMGRPRPWLPEGFRAFPVRPWTIVYRPLVEGGGIYVDRIIDTRRDLDEILL
jgi:plasmid stabilization system protein ParE